MILDSIKTAENIDIYESLVDSYVYNPVDLPAFKADIIALMNYTQDWFIKLKTTEAYYDGKFTINRWFGIHDNLESKIPDDEYKAYFEQMRQYNEKILLMSGPSYITEFDSYVIGIQETTYEYARKIKEEARLIGEYIAETDMYKAITSAVTNTVNTLESSVGMIKWITDHPILVIGGAGSIILGIYSLPYLLISLGLRSRK